MRFRIISFLVFTLSGTFQIMSMDESYSFIRADRIWEYYKEMYIGEGNSAGKTYGKALVRYKFEGEEEAYGKRYARCILTDATVWKSTDSWSSTDIDVSSIKTIEINECVGFVREEGSKVYLLLDRDEVKVCYVPYDTVSIIAMSPGEEVLLFDFGVGEGDISECYLTSASEGEMISGAMVYGSSVEDGTGRNSVTLGNIVPESADPLWEYYERLKITIAASCVEGIGNTGYGEMMRYGGIKTMYIDGVSEKSSAKDNDGWEDEIIRNYLGDGSCFNNYRDMDGNVLYAGKGIEIPDTSGIEAIQESESSSCTYDIYDVLGRRVRSTVPGGVYIRGGKKFVAK